MNEVELKKRAEELEQTLQLQLAQLKKDSRLWLKVGGAALVVGLITYKLIRKPARETSRKSNERAEAGIWKSRGKGKRKSSAFFPPIKKRLLLLLYSLGQSKVMAELNKRTNRADEN